MPQIITHLAGDRREIALTFDACQTLGKPAGYDAKIIAILRRTHTPATLLLGGLWMETHPQITRELGADPLFELGNHSYRHPHMTKITPAEMRVEIEKTQAIMYRLTGRWGKLFRPPYGEYNATLTSVAAGLGLRTLMWSIVTGDPDPHESARAIVHTALTKAKPGSIVIMHVNGRGWHSAEALPSIIAGLRARGFTFVQVSQGLRGSG